MTRILSVTGREVLDSRGNPTVEAEVRLADGTLGRAAVPSGASTGAHEAKELRDGDADRYGGKGVLTAVEHVNGEIAGELEGCDPAEQAEVDRRLVDLDGTPDKRRLGANAVLAVSMASARAAAACAGIPLYRHLGGDGADLLPVPLLNILNGGAHASNNVDIQEFMVAPVAGPTFSEALRAGAEIYHALRARVADAGLSTAVGDEGGVAPDLSSNGEALDLIMAACRDAGYRTGRDVFLALDCAATELLAPGEGEGYRLAGGGEAGEYDASALVDLYERWVDEYPLASIEDGLAEDDWNGWRTLTERLGDRIQLVGDDLFVTSVERLERGIREGVGNAILVKPNQIGTLTETRRAVERAHEAGMGAVMSHRSGETEDPIIADLAVAWGTGQIKTGAPSRSERVAKYNRLLRIEEELGAEARYAGSHGAL
jgi:enolase